MIALGGTDRPVALRLPASGSASVTPSGGSISHDRVPHPSVCVTGRPDRERGQSAASTGDGLWRSLVSALDWGSRGPGFKSRQPDSQAYSA